MRYDITDQRNTFEGFTITDSVTKEIVVIHFAWVGKYMDKTGTWEYCPLCEMTEVDHQGFDKFRLRLHQDEEFAKQQMIMNRRHDIWWDLHKEEKVVARKPRRGAEGYSTLHTKFNNYSIRCKDIDGKKFLFSGSLKDKKIYETHPEWLIESRLWMLYREYQESIRKANRLISRICWRLKINLSFEDVQMFKAYERSNKLLKEWLTEDEYRWLVCQGELRIKHEDETFIIKKESFSKVEVVNKNNEKSSYCFITRDSGVTDPDILLTKILMIKTNPKKFKEIAIRSGG